MIWHGFRLALAMKMCVYIFLLLFPISLLAQDFTIDVDDFLKKRTNGAGLVDYKSIYKNPEDLEHLLLEIASAEPLEGGFEKAFLINTYNLFVIKAVIDNYPVESPLKVDGFFDEQTFNLRGSLVTLNQLEKEILMKQFPDARLHFVLVCAAKGCPKLASFAYNGKELEEQLESQTRAVINDSEFIHLSGPNAQVSQIFDWYAADFGGKDQVIPFIQKYLLKKVKLNPSYSFYEYDWSLNVLK